MTLTNNKKFEETARSYNEILVPALFEPLARLVADAVELQQDSKVLDVGCGTGVLTRELARRVPGNDEIIGLDANPGMIAVAQHADPRIAWQLGDASALPFADGTFDIVASQFALMLFEDREKALREMWRVLSPDGKLVVAVFDTLDANPSCAVIAETYETHSGSATANALRFPFSLGNTDDLTALFENSGIKAPELKTISATAQFSSATQLTHADVKGWFPFAGLDVSTSQTNAIARDLDRVFMDCDGDADGIAFDVSAHIVTATKQ